MICSNLNFLKMKFGDLFEFKFLKNFVPVVFVFLPLIVFYSLFPCVCIYLFYNDFVLFIFVYFYIS